MSSIELSLMEDDPWHSNQLLFDELRNYLQPDSSVTAGDVVHRLDSLFPAHRDVADQPPDSPIEDASTFFWNIWEPFHIAARQLPHNSVEQEKLVACLREICSTTSKTPVVTMEEYHCLPARQCRMWQDMHQIEGKFWEMARFMRCEVGVEGPWRNFMAYAARLTRDGIADLSEFGKMSLDEALAEVVEERNRRRDFVQVPQKIEATLDPGFEHKVAVAADWIGYAGDALFEKLYEAPHEKASVVQGWQFWIRRFGEIAENQRIPQWTREMAKAAMENMEAKTENGMHDRTET